MIPRSAWLRWAGLLPALALWGPATLPSEEALRPEAVRELKEAGRIRPLDELLQPVMERLEGVRLLETELYPAEVHDRLTYEVTILDAHGRVHEVYLDARTGQIQATETEAREADKEED